MAMTVAELRLASQSIKTLVQSNNVGTMIQEFQMMGLYDQYYLAANYKRESRLVPDDLVSIHTIAGFATRITSVTRAADAENAASKATAKQLIIIDGASDADNIIHAEQTLLLVLCHRLKNGMTAPNLAIAGCKVACTKCFKVLKAFATAYKGEYQKILDYEDDRTGAFGTDGDAKIKKIDLAGEFPALGPSSRLSDLLTQYSALV